MRLFIAIAVPQRAIVTIFLLSELSDGMFISASTTSEHHEKGPAGMAGLLLVPQAVFTFDDSICLMVILGLGRQTLRSGLF